MIERRCSFLVVSAGKPVGEVEPHLVPEDAERAGAGAVGLLDARREDPVEEVEVLPHGPHATPDRTDRPGM